MKGKCIVYTDGSANLKEKAAGSAWIQVELHNNIEVQVCSWRQSSYAANNIEAELYAVENAIEHALQGSYTVLEIRYDLEGIERWATGAWKAKKPSTQDYVEIIKDARAKGLLIIFKKVKAHSGVQYNELADGLAKQSMNELIDLMLKHRAEDLAKAYEEYPDEI